MLLASVLFLIAGIALMGLAYGIHRSDAALQRWPAVPADLLSTRIVHATEGRVVSELGSPRPRAQPEYRTVEVWRLEVAYRYAIGGRTYEGDRATSTPVVEEVESASGEAGTEIQELARQLEGKTSTTAHVDPSDPRRSYLIYQARPVGGFLVSACLLIVIGLFGAVWSRR